MPIVTSAASLHLFFLSALDPGSGSSISILNKGNARLSALRSKVVECTKLYQSGPDIAARMERVVDLGITAVTCTNLNEERHWEGEGLKLRDSRAGTASKWSVISNEEKTHETLLEAYKCISGGDKAADAGAAFSMSNYFDAVIQWWKDVVSWDAATIAHWIKGQDWSVVVDVWMGDDTSGHNNVSDLVDARLASTHEDEEEKKGFLLRFVLMNFARLTKIACIAPDGLHRLIAAFSALHQYLIEKELHKLTDGTLQFEVNLLIRQNNQPIFGYINDCKEASYNADSVTKKLPLSILNAMIDLILKIEDNLGEEWVGYGEMFEKFLKFFGSHEYIQLLMNIFTEDDYLKGEFDKRSSDAAAAASTNQETFNLNAELHCDLTLDPDPFEDFFRDVLLRAQMHPALIDNMKHHFAWKRKQLGEGQEIPPTKITAFELTDALHQLWTYHLIATLHQQLSSLNVTAIMLLGLPLNEEAACFDMSQETFFRLFATVPNPAKLTTLPGLSGSRANQNQWQSEILAHLNRSLGGEGHRQGDGDNLGLSSKALNAITLCLANFLDKEVSKSLQLFLSTTASSQDEAMHTLQCLYAFFGTYLIQFELVFDTRKLTSKKDRVKWASGDVISMAFAVKLLDAALKHVTDDGFVSQNDSVESRFVPDPHINLHIRVNLSFGTTNRTFQVNGRGSGCFVATCLNLKAALSRVFQPVQRSSLREQARGLWRERWGFDFSQEPQLLGGMVMNYASQEGISTNLNIGLGFIARGFVDIRFAHLELSELGAGVDGLALNHATEEDDDEGRSAPGDGDDSVSDQGQEGNSAEESSSPSRGKSIDLLRSRAASSSRKRPPNDSNAASDAAGKRKRSGEETVVPHQQEERKKSGRKSISGKGDKKNKKTDFLLNQLGYMHEKGLFGSGVLESAVRKCGSDPENYDSHEHSQKFENWMWSNVAHLFDCGNGNGNGDGDGEVLGADVFFNTVESQPEPLRGLNIEAAAKGKGKAQRQTGADDDMSSSSSSMDDPSVAAAKGKGKAQRQTGEQETNHIFQDLMGMDGETISDLLEYLEYDWPEEGLGYANTKDTSV